MGKDQEERRAERDDMEGMDEHNGRKVPEGARPCSSYSSGEVVEQQL